MFQTWNQAVYICCLQESYSLPQTLFFFVSLHFCWNSKPKKFKFGYLQETLVYEPSKRISAKKALDHPYFEDLDKSQF